MSEIPFNYKSLANRIKDIILNPREEWPKIAVEPISNKDIILQVVLPLTLIAALISLFVVWLGTYLTFGVALKVAVLRFVLPMVTIIIAAIIANELAETFNSAKNLNASYKLIAYSSIPWLLTNIVVSLFWSLTWLTILGLYGVYLLYTGIPILMKTPEDKNPVYTLTVVVLIFVIQLILSAIFSVNRLG